MKKPHVLCIAPYEGMHHTISQISEKCADAVIEVFLGDMEAGVSAAKEHMTADVDVIVSRGLTARMIEEVIDCPVVSVTFSPYDVLRAIQSAQILSDRFAIIGNQSIADSAKLLCDSLQYNQAIVWPFDNLTHLKEQLADLKRQGYDLIVGDRITVTSAQDMGMRAILIASGIDSIQDAINKAVLFCSYSNKLKKSVTLFQRILAEQSSKMAVFDAGGGCVFSTLSPEEAPLVQDFSEQLPNIRSKPSSPIQVVQISGYHVRIQTFDVDGSRHILFQIIDFIPQSVAGTAIRSYSSEELFQEYGNLNWGNSQTVTQFLDSVRRYAAAAYPILLAGAGKEDSMELAAFLYRQCTERTRPFVRIDCAKMSGRQWDFLLESTNSPLYRLDIAFYLHNADAVDEAWRDRLFSYLQDITAQRRTCTIISFCQRGVHHLPDELHSFAVLHVPTLREHTEDITEISNIYISEINQEYGKRVISLSPEALTYLQQMQTLTEVSQLKEALRKAVIQTDNFYISEQTIALVLPQKSDAPDTASVLYWDFDRTKTLKEIERGIILQIYQEENMNQSKTAKRLGISRSTLWRILSEN